MQNKVESKCSSYIRTTVDINFPTNGGQCCQYCPLLETYSRSWCKRTGELIADVRGIGMWCPLQVQEVIELNDQTIEEAEEIG